VLAGQPLVVALELDPAGGALEVTGRLAGSTEPWVWRLVVPSLAAREGVVTTVPIGALYGRETIADYELSPKRWDERLLEIALRHRIASRVTSLVAISEEPTVDPKAPRRSVTLPVELPAFTSAEGVGLNASIFSRHLLRLDDDAMPAFQMKAEQIDYRKHRASRPAVKSPRFDVLRRILGGLRAPRAASEARALRARVVAVTGSVLVVELEAPSDGFLRPDGQVQVVINMNVVVAGTIDPTASSPRGPHEQGLWLRVVIVGSSDWVCLVGDEVAIIGGTIA